MRPRKRSWGRRGQPDARPVVSQSPSSAGQGLGAKSAWLWYHVFIERRIGPGYCWLGAPGTLRGAPLCSSKGEDVGWCRTRSRSLCHRAQLAISERDWDKAKTGLPDGAGPALRIWPDVALRPGDGVLPTPGADQRRASLPGGHAPRSLARRRFHQPRGRPQLAQSARRRHHGPAPWDSNRWAARPRVTTISAWSIAARARTIWPSRPIARQSASTRAWPMPTSTLPISFFDKQNYRLAIQHYEDALKVRSGWEKALDGWSKPRRR